MATSMGCKVGKGVLVGAARQAGSSSNIATKVNGTLFDGTNLIMKKGIAG
jgi:hypothetical protein